MARELIIYADESDESGPFYANFYGGALVESADLAEVESRLREAKTAQNLLAEVKWGKVTENYLRKYIAAVDEFFALMGEGKVKVRIMFRHLYRRPTGLSEYHRQNSYHILYYLFLKHAFGLEFCNPERVPVRIRYYLDRIPDTRERNSVFKGYVGSLENYPPFRRAHVRVPEDQIAEVDSHDHVVMQFLDIVLGAVQFRLNDKHLSKPANASRRGKKTIAKEKLYRHINHRVRQLYPNFNIGATTGMRGDQANRWLDPYRHWCFTPREFELDATRVKPK
jgi:hypothetical protein